MMDEWHNIVRIIARNWKSAEKKRRHKLRARALTPGFDENGRRIGSWPLTAARGTGKLE